MSASVRKRPVAAWHQLIGDVVPVRTDDLRLRADSQDVAAHPLDQGGLPAHSDVGPVLSGMLSEFEGGLREGRAGGTMIM